MRRARAQDECKRALSTAASAANNRGSGLGELRFPIKRMLVTIGQYNDLGSCQRKMVGDLRC
ncbi:hypothetical protein LMG27198_51530 [Methylocystis echinoides]|uniref:Uncharacterized protein n=1 Tax=Methylocystis echinoides TaxID=29468 RepID=A0A9W6H0H4_9HYPH|nr:hypothetical protein LMG27198_51530 [Methylocystis echinoides]